MPIADLRFKKQDGTYMPLYAASGESILGLLGLGANSIKYLDQIFKGNINMFAKYKPVKNNSVTPGADYWKANNGQCGIVIPQLSNDLSDFTTKVWTYDRPRGNNIVAGEHLRVNDFFYYGKYNKNAQPPIKAENYNKLVVNPEASTAGLRVGFNLRNYDSGSPASSNLTAAEIGVVERCYIAVAIVPVGGTQPDPRKTQTAITMINAYQRVDIDFTHDTLLSLANGEYDLCLFLADKSKHYGEYPVAGTSFYPFPTTNSVPNRIKMKVESSLLFFLNVSQVKGDDGNDWVHGGDAEKPINAIYASETLYLKMLTGRNYGAPETVDIEAQYLTAEVVSWNGTSIQKPHTDWEVFHISGNSTHTTYMDIKINLDAQGKPQPLPVGRQLLCRIKLLYRGKYIPESSKQIYIKH